MLSKQLSKKITSDLYLKIPEVKIYVDEYIDNEYHSNAYLIFGPFGSLLTDWIMAKDQPEIVDKAYSFINQLCDNGEREIEELLKVTFFEVLTDFKKTIEESRLKLDGKALTYFKEVLLMVANMQNNWLYGNQV